MTNNEKKQLDERLKRLNDAQVADGGSTSSGSASTVVPFTRPTTRPNVTIIRADPELLSAYWKDIRAGLIALKAKSNASKWSLLPMASWEPANVRTSVMLGFNNDLVNGAELWLGMTPSPNSRLAGFAVTSMSFEPFLKVPYAMFVWIAYAFPNVKSDIVPAMDTHLTNLARSRGLEYLEAMTKREGLVRRLAKFGWENHLIVIRKPVWGDKE